MTLEVHDSQEDSSVLLLGHSVVNSVQVSNFRVVKALTQSYSHHHASLLVWHTAVSLSPVQLLTYTLLLLP